MAVSENGKVARKLTVLVVDDHPVVVAGLAMIINSQRDLTCCAKADCIASARRKFNDCAPDLVTVDLRLPDGDGVDLIKHFIATKPCIPILVISSQDEVLYAERALKAGARGYLMKERAAEEIVMAIRTILSGELYFSAKVAAVALNQLAGRKAVGNHKALNALTDRELHVLQLLGAGLGTRMIAAKLGLSIKTIETHRENIKHKLHINSAAGLVHYAVNWVENRNQNPQASQGNP